MNGKGKTYRSKTPNSGKFRNFNDTYNRYKNHNRKLLMDKSVSPMRRPSERSTDEKYLKLELEKLNIYEKKCKMLKGKLVKEYNMEKKNMFKLDSKIKTDTARIESEKEKILLTLIELMLKGKVKIEVPNNYVHNSNHQITTYSISSRFTKKSE